MAGERGADAMRGGAVNYPRHRRTEVMSKLRAEAIETVDAIVTAMENGLPLADARRELLDALTIIGCEIERERILKGEAA